MTAGESPSKVRTPRAGPWRWALYAVLLVAVGVRFRGLSDQSYWLDELWGMEIACGRGADHQALPTNQILNAPPELTNVASAPRAWHVWTGLDRVTGPPGSYLLLRAWMELFGQSEAATRSLSAVCSVIAVAMLFLAVRSWGGVEAGAWAAAQMAVAGPQVHAAQDARPYALLVMLGTVALWAVARTVGQGASRGRSVALAVVLWSMLMTHYFAVGAVAAVGAYGVIGTRGKARRHLVTATVVAGAAFAVLWGPFMLRQMAAFSPGDRAAAFLREAGPGHVASTAWRLVTIPASMWVDARPIPRVYAVVGIGAYGLMLAATARRRWPALWPMWFGGIVAVLAVLDLTRSTSHLAFLRYALLAGPAVYAVAGAMTRDGASALERTVGRCVAGAALAFAVWSLPRANLPPNDDFRAMGESLRASVQPGELTVFAGPADTYSPQIRYLAAAHYARPIAGPVMLLESPASPAVMQQVAGRPTVWLVADPTVTLARAWLPGYHLAAGQSWPVVGSVLRMDRDIR